MRSLNDWRQATTGLSHHQQPSVSERPVLYTTPVPARNGNCLSSRYFARFGSCTERKMTQAAEQTQFAKPAKPNQLFVASNQRTSEHPVVIAPARNTDSCFQSFVKPKDNNKKACDRTRDCFRETWIHHHKDLAVLFSLKVLTRNIDFPDGARAPQACKQAAGKKEQLGKPLGETWPVVQCS